ncbi:hypothetical protein GW17_00048798 [Ensete ventricosum]|nr:hypothetical protein GW17_00048798 [Ensete ventricosum]
MDCVVWRGSHVTIKCELDALPLMSDYPSLSPSPTEQLKTRHDSKGSQFLPSFPFVKLLNTRPDHGKMKSTMTAANSTVRKAPVAPATKATGPKKPAFKLYERRNSLKNLKILSPLIPTFFNSNPSTPVTAAGFSPRKQPEILSPSILDFPSLVLSPITPLIPDPFNRSPHPNSEAAKWAEDRAIAEKGFYLHPSPRASAEADPPRLLPLFPVTSPEVSSDLSLAMPRSSTRAV